MHVARTAPGLEAPYSWQRDVVLRAEAPLSLRLVARPNHVDPGCRNDPAKVPHKLSGPDPYYTEEALARNREGTALVTCIVGVEGVARGCVPLLGAGPMTDVFIDAIERRTYSPAVCDGKKIEIDYLFKLMFRTPN